MRPLIRQLWEIGVHVDYRPGGVSLTNRNFANLECDRRMNAERVLFLLAKISPEELARLGICADDGSETGVIGQLFDLDRKIRELHEAHARLIAQKKPTPINARILNEQERQYVVAMRDSGIPWRFIEDGFHDYVRQTRP